jgi:3'-phosphoadenosine 5'-phosphosulfate sulfotransferase (PAPS reductase)/FAD synthetase
MQINHVGVSGGKDSTALLLWAVHESGYPRESLRASFADTGNELDVTYDYVRMLGETVFPITWLKPERDFYELAKHKKRFPRRGLASARPS